MYSLQEHDAFRLSRSQNVGTNPAMCNDLHQVQVFWPDTMYLYIDSGITLSDIVLPLPSEIRNQISRYGIQMADLQQT